MWQGHPESHILSQWDAQGLLDYPRNKSWDQDSNMSNLFEKVKFPYKSGEVY